MEILVMDKITGFEDGLNSLLNPSFISRLFHLARFEEISRIYSVWTWGAMILAFLATFSSLIRRTKRLIYRIWKDKSVVSEPLIKPLIDEDDEEESCSSSFSDDEDEHATWSFQNRRSEDEDFRVAGSRNYEKTHCEDWFSWFDFGEEKSVVRLWDGLGLWDLNKDAKMNSFFSQKCQIPAVSMTSPGVIVTAGLENSERVGMRVWDARIGRQIPAIFAEWQTRRSKILGVESGDVKVYLRDDCNGLTVRDIRKVGSPFEDLTESYRTTWWDADAVIVEDDDRDGGFDVSPVYGRGSVVSRCRNAV